MAAIDSFNAGIEEVRGLLSIDVRDQSGVGDGELGAESSTSAGLMATTRRAAVVLLVSHFEGFLKELVEELVDDLDSQSLPAKEIPRGVRELHILPKLSEVVSCGDVNQRFSLMSKLGAVSSLWNDSAKPPRGTLRAQIVSREVHNADSECIDRIFFTLGSGNPVCDGEIDVIDQESELEESHSIRVRLRDIVECRNDIAHGNMDRKPTGEDVARYVLFLLHFAKRLNRKADDLRSRWSTSSAANKKA
ncbi:MAE_28990/MAE_18760 family HEPN-like nuclease [Amycolatopsis mediterranei]|uniref:MAE_28990/MAE_18760 family HEPN-like nuclease n=1 Tax=Amycolatopsis mediterranei TaxID=33910 RepID=UPI000B0E6E54|nr:MAE_28990/MAE_18760 family HEPN-like nuclease [Amycolatopsis mediterranei]UZF74631.1 MAE_28990/MAE_18760 family HEPN-like nuclease [Amycolatopsis mediterranei]